MICGAGFPAAEEFGRKLPRISELSCPFAAIYGFENSCLVLRSNAVFKLPSQCA